MTTKPTSRRAGVGGDVVAVALVATFFCGDIDAFALLVDAVDGVDDGDEIQLRSEKRRDAGCGCELGAPAPLIPFNDDDL